MGLFDFVRNVGKSVFGGGSDEAEAAAKIKAEIEGANPGMSDLTVQYNQADGKVALSGTATSAAAMEKAVLMAGNIQGVADVDASGIQHPSATAEHIDYYIIQAGDTLSKIAQHFYHDGNKYGKIFEANREVIRDANTIFPGQKIRIPLDA